MEKNQMTAGVRSLMVGKMWRLLFVPTLCVVFTYPTFAEDIIEYSPLAPTSFKKNYSLTPSDSTDEIVMSSPSTQVNDVGGELKSKTLSIRGSDSSEVGVDMEGIRLNSAARGTANFGEIDTFGLESMEVIRGGYPFFQASPGGQVLFRLPRKASLLSRAEIGSFRSWMFGQLTPVGSIAVRRTQGNFEFDSGGISGTRKNNGSVLATARLWKFGSDWQVWGQSSFSDQSLSGPVSFMSADDFLQTYQAQVAAQKVWKKFEVSVWSQFQNQETFSFSSLSRNWSTYHGARIERRHMVGKRTNALHRAEIGHDYLNNNTLTHSHRLSLIYALSVLYELKAAQVLNPRLRLEYLNDLHSPFGVHTGMGGKHRVQKNTDLLWNASWISRAPTFYELYFKDPFFKPNPNLKRQNSYLFDFGFVYSNEIFTYQPVGFVTKTLNRIETVVESPTLSSVDNRGSSLTWGVENHLKISFSEKLSQQVDYTYQQPKAKNHDRVYQPRHRVQASIAMKPRRELEISIPFYFRSKVRAPDFYANPEVKSQYDLGAKLLLKRKKWSFDFTAKNLLGQAREEIKEYPLPAEPSFKFGIERSW